MDQQGYDPSELFELLGKAHLPNLSEDHLRMIAARVVGMTYAEVGERMVLDERTILTAVSEVGKAVALACGLPRKDDHVTASWFFRHADCERGCTAFGMGLLKSGGLFEESKQ